MEKHQLLNQLRQMATSDKASFLNVLQAVLDAGLWKDFVQMREEELSVREMTREESLKAKKEKIKQLSKQSFDEFDEVYKNLAWWII